MDALLLLFACLGLGMVVARVARPPEGFVRSLNWWVLYIALPAIVLELIPRVRFDPQLWFLPVAMWFVFAGAWVVAEMAGRWLGWSRERIGAVILAAGLGNTAFAGYPLIEMLRGKDGLALAVVADQLGGAIALATGGVLVASLYSGGRPQPREILRRLFLFPAFIALIFGVAAGLMGGWPSALEKVFARIGATLTPLALFSIGMQLRLRLARAQLGAVAVSLGWKMALAPALVFLAGAAIGMDGPILAVAVLQAAMAPMVTTAILADQYGLDTEVANMSLGIGIVLSLILVPLINPLL